MISSINIPDRLALMDNGQTVPLRLLKGDEVLDDGAGLQDADRVIIGPYYEWNGQKYDKKYAEVKTSDIDLQ